MPISRTVFRWTRQVLPDESRRLSVSRGPKDGFESASRARKIVDRSPVLDLRGQVSGQVEVRVPGAVWQSSARTSNPTPWRHTAQARNAIAARQEDQGKHQTHQYLLHGNPTSIPGARSRSSLDQSHHFLRCSLGRYSLWIPLVGGGIFAMENDKQDVHFIGDGGINHGCQEYQMGGNTTNESCHDIDLGKVDPRACQRLQATER